MAINDASTPTSVSAPSTFFLVILIPLRSRFSIADFQSVFGLCRLWRNIFGLDVATNHFARAVRRRSVPAAAADLHGDDVAGTDRITLGLEELLTLARKFCNSDEAARCRLAALHAPRRTMPAVEI